MKAIRYAVTHPVTVWMVTLAAVVFGLTALGRLDMRLLPEIRYPSLTVQTDFPGTAPVDVENLVTRPLEESVGVVPGPAQGPLHQPGRPVPDHPGVQLGHGHGLRGPGRAGEDRPGAPARTRPPFPLLLKYDPGPGSGAAHRPVGRRAPGPAAQRGRRRAEEGDRGPARAWPRPGCPAVWRRRSGSRWTRPGCRPWASPSAR